MNCPCLTNERGVSLAELVVAMAVTAILMVMVIYGAVFVQDYLSRWKHRDTVAEEISFVLDEMQEALTVCRSLSQSGDTLLCVMPDGALRTYTWRESALTRNGISLTRAGMQVNSLDISKYILNDRTQDTILVEKAVPGLYVLSIVVSDKDGRVDSLSTLVRNDAEYFKHKTD